MTSSQDPRRPPATEQSPAASNGALARAGWQPRPGGQTNVDDTRPQALVAELWRAVRRRRLVFLQALLVVPLAAVVVALLQDEAYTATASLLFRESPSVLQSEDQRGVDDPSREAATNEELIALPVVAARAAASLGGAVDAETIEDSVTIESTGEANLVEIQATAATAELASRVANSYGEAYIDFRRRADRRQIEEAVALVRRGLATLSAQERAARQGQELRARLGELELARSLQTGNAELVQRAEVPSSPSSPNLRRNLVLGILLGALLGIALAYLLDRTDRRLKSVEELEEVYGLPVLGRIPRSASLGRGVVPGDRQLPMDREEVEVFRTLRANLRFFNVDEPIRSVLVASPLAGDGKSTVARVLAMTMAAMGDRVILVEADLHKPGLETGDGRRADPGLSSLLSGANLKESIIEMPVFLSDDRTGRSLATIPSGPPPPNPSQLLESARMESVLRVLEDQYETVIIDSPALAMVSDALALVPTVSGVIMVSGVGQTSRDAALGARKQISLLGGRILGVVANFAESQPRGGYYNSSSPARTPVTAR